MGGMWTEPAGRPDWADPYHEEAVAAHVARLDREARRRLALAVAWGGILLATAGVYGLAGYGLYRLIWG
jgi:hypothetical protein